MHSFKLGIELTAHIIKTPPHGTAPHSIVLETIVILLDHRGKIGSRCWIRTNDTDFADQRINHFSNRP